MFGRTARFIAFVFLIILAFGCSSGRQSTEVKQLHWSEFTATAESENKAAGIADLTPATQNTLTFTATPTFEPTATPNADATITLVISPTSTANPMMATVVAATAIVITPSLLPTPISLPPTATATATATAIAPITPTPTPTPTPTLTPTPTPTPTLTPTPTPTPTLIPIPVLSEHAAFDRPDDTPNRNQIHFVYAIASDVTDAEYDINGTIAESAAVINDWLVLNGSSPFAYDTYEGELDVTFVRLKRTAREYRNKRTDMHGTLRRDLANIGLRDPAKLYAVYFQGSHVFGSPGRCGEHALRFAMTYVTNPCSSEIQAKNETGHLSTTSSIMLHEMLHGIGAVPGCAPNGVSGGHTDSPNYDLMAQDDSVTYRAQGYSVLDPGRDDYFGHGRSDCDDIANSVFLNPLPEGWIESPTGLDLRLASISVDSTGTTHGVGVNLWANPDDVEENYLEYIRYQITSTGELISSDPTSKRLEAIHATQNDTILIGGRDDYSSILGTVKNDSVDWWTVPRSALNNHLILSISSSTSYIFAASVNSVAKFDHNGRWLSSWDVTDTVGGIRSISTNSDGDIFLGSETGIHKFSDQGEYLGAIDSGITGWQQVIIDRDDNMYVIGEPKEATVYIDQYNKKALKVVENARTPIIVLDKTGQQVEKIGTWGLYGTQLLGPTDISVGANGEVVVVDDNCYQTRCTFVQLR